MTRFDDIYKQGTPPWDIGRPQDAFVQLARDAKIRGTVLDVGCGTGENALYLASLGHVVWGIDSVPAAIAKAQQKAHERGVNVVFLVESALTLERLLGFEPPEQDAPALGPPGAEPPEPIERATKVLRPLMGRPFDTVIDSGLFHTFDPAERARFVASLGRVLRPGGTYHMLCFSDEQPGTEGPKRIRQEEIREAFGTGWWQVETIVPARFASHMHEGGAKAWLATILRTKG